MEGHTTRGESGGGEGHTTQGWEWGRGRAHNAGVGVGAMKGTQRRGGSGGAPQFYIHFDGYASTTVYTSACYECSAQRTGLSLNSVILSDIDQCVKKKGCWVTSKTRVGHYYYAKEV